MEEKYESKSVKSTSETKQIKVNLPLEDYKKIKALAVENEISMAEYVRKKLGANFPGKRKRNINLEHKKVIYHLAKIGSNINQISKSLNKILKLNDSELQPDIDRKVYEDIHLIKMYLHRLASSLL